MIFNNFNFIFLFLPAFLLSYYIASDNFKNVVIFIYSILYYIIGNYNNYLNIILLFALTLINYLFYYIIFIETDVNNKKTKLFISIFFNILILATFKSGYLIKNMPSGLSFYVFHYLSILIDTYKRENNNLKISFFKFFQYIIFFPKILSGPITRYDYFENSHDNKKSTLDSFIKGLYIFAVGLAIKCILSDNIYNIINQINVYGYESISILTSWLGMYCFTMNLYFDFAGYSLMAIGLAKSIGMNLPENFNLPFYSLSVSEFWRRWHITLGQFFKDYVYIPLGGNFGNKNIAGQVRNIIIVWVITGLWHGFKINYILWAIIIFIVIILEKIILLNIYKKYSFIGHLIVLIFIPFTFVIFSIENLDSLKIYLSKLIDFSTLNNVRDFESLFNSYYKIFLIGICFMTNVPKTLFMKLLNNRLLMIIVTIVLIILSCYMININSLDTFKYFTF